jgi:hypothetical protein
LDVFGAKLIRRPMEIFRELPQSERVRFYSSLGIIATVPVVNSVQSEMPSNAQ